MGSHPLDANGTLDGTFGAGGFKLGSPLAGTGSHDFRGQAVALQSDGSIIVAGIDYWGTTGDTQHPLLMRFFGTTTANAVKAFSVAAGSAGVTQVTGPLRHTIATATPSTDVPGVSTALVLKPASRAIPSAPALPAPRRVAAIPTTVTSTPDPIFVPLVLDDHPFLDTLIAGKRRRSG